MVKILGKPGRPKLPKNAIPKAIKRLVPLTPEEVKKTPIGEVRLSYNKLALDYNRIMERDLVYCIACDDFHKREYFYEDNRFGCGVYPECKESLKMQAMDYDKKTDTYKDNKDKTIEVFRKLDIPFIEAIYDRALQQTNDETRVGGSPRAKSNAFQHSLTTIKSLHQYSGLGFINSQYDDTAIYEATDERTAREDIKKVFGDGLTEADYLYLQDQYDDWYARTQIDTKAQETLVVQICFAQMNLWKAQKSGKDTKDLVKSLNDLMGAANLQPKQNVNNASGDNLSYGQQIEKLEMTRPVSEVSEEFKDVDGIMKYISTWFLGHIAKAFGLNNVYSQMYENEIKKYTVEPPKFEMEGNSKEIRQRLFGKGGE